MEGWVHYWSGREVKVHWKHSKKNGTSTNRVVLTRAKEWISRCRVWCLWTSWRLATELRTIAFRQREDRLRNPHPIGLVYMVEVIVMLQQLRWTFSRAEMISINTRELFHQRYGDRQRAQLNRFRKLWTLCGLIQAKWDIQASRKEDHSSFRSQAPLFKTQYKAPSLITEGAPQV